NVTLQANAINRDARVEIFALLVVTPVLCPSTGSPYSFTWSAVPAGNYSLTAKATDNQGAAATSGAVSITVNPANVSPSVTIISQIGRASCRERAKITVQAEAVDKEGSMEEVD